MALVDSYTVRIKDIALKVAVSKNRMEDRPGWSKFADHMTTEESGIMPFPS